MNEENHSLEPQIQLKTFKNPTIYENSSKEKNKPFQVIYDDEKKFTERLCICNRHNIFYNFFIKLFYCFFGLIYSQCVLCCDGCQVCSSCYMCCLICNKCKKIINEETYESLDQTEVFKDATDLDPRTSFFGNINFVDRFQISKLCYKYAFFLRNFIRIPKFSCCSSKRKAVEIQAKIDEALKLNEVEDIEKLKAAKIQEGGFMNNSCKEICVFCFRDPKKFILNDTITNISQGNPIYYFKSHLNDDFEKIPVIVDMVQVKGMGQ